jgi:hypothetical protein
MEILEVDDIEYTKIFHKTYHVFNHANFNILNKKKCDGLKFLLFKDKKYRLGLIGGIKNKKLESPFSSPFGGFSFLKSNIQIQVLEGAIDLLEAYCQLNNIENIEFTPPPLLYNEIFLSKFINVLYRKSYIISNIDLDFYLSTSDFDKSYFLNIWPNARQKLNVAKKNKLSFNKCTDIDDKEEVFRIIKENRILKNRPLYMTFEEVICTSRIINVDFFLLKYGNLNIASAIVYHVAKGIVYVPFWADKADFSEMRPMNFLSYKIFEYYSLNDIRIIHVGISSKDSVPNYGLCEFKESIGCLLTPKITFSKII